MNGTTLRIATAAACVAALAAPSAALAKTHHAHKAKAPVTKKAATAPAPIVTVPHDYDAGGNGAPLVTIPAGVRLNLFDPVQLATALGDQALGQLGLPPVSQTVPITLPQFP